MDEEQRRHKTQNLNGTGEDRMTRKTKTDEHAEPTTRTRKRPKRAGDNTKRGTTKTRHQGQQRREEDTKLRTTSRCRTQSKFQNWTCFFVFCFTFCSSCLLYHTSSFSSRTSLVASPWRLVLPSFGVSLESARAGPALCRSFPSSECIAPLQTERETLEVARILSQTLQDSTLNANTSVHCKLRIECKHISAN